MIDHFEACNVQMTGQCVCRPEPSSLAAAWDQGYKTAMFDREFHSHNTNPYRKADA